MKVVAYLYISNTPSYSTADNPLVPVLPRPVPTRNWINNVLLEEARKEFELKKKKAKEQAALSQESKFNDEEID